MALTPITREFAKRIKSLSWDEVRSGIENKWLEPSIAVDKAMVVVSSDEYSDLELALASLGYDQTTEILTAVNELSPSEIESGLDQRKWSKILLTWLYLHRSSYSDPLQEIEILYADLGYPEEIAHLVRYMPAEGEQDLHEEWVSYTSDNEFLVDLP